MYGKVAVLTGVVVVVVGGTGGCPRDLTDGAVTLSFRSNSVQPQPGLNPTRGERGATRTDDQREERGRKHKKGRERDCLERRKIDRPIYRWRAETREGSALKF